MSFSLFMAWFRFDSWLIYIFITIFKCLLKESHSIHLSEPEVLTIADHMCMHRFYCGSCCPICSYICCIFPFILWPWYCLSFLNNGLWLCLWYLQNTFFKICSVCATYNVCQRLTMIYYFPFYSGNYFSNTYKLNPCIQVYVSVIL